MSQGSGRDLSILLDSEPGTKLLTRRHVRCTPAQIHQISSWLRGYGPPALVQFRYTHMPFAIHGQRDKVVRHTRGPQPPREVVG